MKNLIYISLISALIFTSCGKEEDKQTQLKELKQQQKEINKKIAKLEAELKGTKKDTSSKATIVQTVAVSEAPFVHFIEIQGRIDSDKNITLSAKSAGTVTRVLVDEGQAVKKGQLLAQIESEIVQKSIAELQTSLDFANNVFEKQKRLWEQKIGTELQYLQAKNNKESLEGRMASLREQLDLARITAPFAGVVDEVYIKEGEVAAPGTPAVRIVNPSDFKAVAEIAENYMNNVKPGNNVTVSLPDVNKTVEAKVSTVSKVINQVNRTFTVEVKLPAEVDKVVKANMIAYINIEDYKNKDALMVPINVIQHSEDDGDYVFVAENGKAVQKPVKVGKTYRNDAEIISGLKPGEKLIVAGYQDLVDQQAIAFNN